MEVLSISDLGLKMRGRWVLLLFILTAILYLRALPGEFVWDDHTFFLENDILPQLQPWSLEIFLRPSNLWGEHLPVRDFMYVLQYNLFGENTYGYHAVSLLLYIAVCYLIYLFLSDIYKVRLGQEGSVAPTFFVMALFSLHPVHVESVAYISGQKDLLCALFSLLAIRQLQTVYSKDLGFSLKSLLPMVLFYYLTFLSKHYMAVSTALFIPLFWFLVLRKKDDSIFKSLLVWSIVNLPVVLWLFYSLDMLGPMSAVNMSTLSYLDRILRGIRILGAHTILAFKPQPLNFGYFFESTWSPDMNFWVGTAVLCSILSMVFWRPRSLSTLGLLIYFVYMFPMLQIIVDAANASIYDRYLFLSALGLAVVVERIFLPVFYSRKRARPVLAFLFIVLLLAMGMKTYRYIPTFRSNLDSTENSYRNYPHWNEAAFDYVTALVEAGELDRAMELTETEESFSHPLWVRDYFRGWIYLERGETDRAMDHLMQSSYLIGSYFPFPDLLLGKALFMRGEYSIAEQLLENVVDSAAGYPLARYRADKVLDKIRQSGKNR
jgi:hypothetical protein